MTDKKWREVYVEKIHQYKSDKYNVCRDNLDCYDHPNIPTKYLKFIEHSAYQELQKKLEIAREALESYASMDQVFGRKARQALEKIK